MQIYFAVFKSKTDVYAFLYDLKASGGEGSLAPTPKQAKIGCGTSVKFPKKYINLVKSLVKSGRYKSFYAILIINNSDSRVSKTL